VDRKGEEKGRSGGEGRVEERRKEKGKGVEMNAAYTV